VKSDYDWEYLFGGLRYDQDTGLHEAGPGFYHADLGRGLPAGEISVLPESALNAYVQDFPFGSYQPPGIMGRQATERFMKWAAEQPAWLKYSIGFAAMVGAAASAVVVSLGNPWYGGLMGVGSLCGGIHGAIDASLSGAILEM
jgi:hypothetical protein